jgi:hypothetical protein
MFDISRNLPRGTENNHETLQSGYPASSQNTVPQHYTADPKYIKNQQMQFNIIYFIHKIPDHMFRPELRPSSQ